MFNNIYGQFLKFLFPLWTVNIAHQSIIKVYYFEDVFELDKILNMHICMVDT